MIQLGWQNISIFLSTANPLHILYLRQELLNGHIPAYLVSSLELSPPCNKPFTNSQSNESAALAERPVTIMALQATASPLAILTDGRSAPFNHSGVSHTLLSHLQTALKNRALAKFPADDPQGECQQTLSLTECSPRL